jgi:hypothetical protein
LADAALEMREAKFWLAGLRRKRKSQLQDDQRWNPVLEGVLLVNRGPKMFASAPAAKMPACSIWAFERPAAFVIQPSISTMTEALAQYVVTQGDEEALKLSQRLGRSFVSLYDCSSIKYVEPNARKVLLDWSVRRKTWSERSYICISPEASVFLEIAVMTGIVGVRLLGVDITLVADMSQVMKDLGLTPQH